MKNFILLSLMFSVLFTACVDRDFDEPPAISAEDPDIREDQIITIADMKAMRDSEQFTEIGLDMFLRVVVVADDESGNFFRTIVVQDETGGISVLLDDVELWNRFFEGKRLFINLKDMWIGEFNGLPQIGFEPFLDDSNRLTMARIPALQIDNVILRGINTEIPEPRIRTINTLSEDDLNTLIQLEDVEFGVGSAGATFADAVSQQAVNHTLQDCSSNTMILRSSGFASFAGELTPAGNGSVRGIYGLFGSDRQLLIRDTDDVQMAGQRCDGSGGGGGTIEVDPDDIVTIASILDRWIEGQEVALSGDEVLQANVVSSDETGNFFRNIVIEDETGGIILLSERSDYCLLYTSPSPRDATLSRMPSSA